MTFSSSLHCSLSLSHCLCLSLCALETSCLQATTVVTNLIPWSWSWSSSVWELWTSALTTSLERLCCCSRLTHHSQRLPSSCRSSFFELASFYSQHHRPQAHVSLITASALVPTASRIGCDTKATEMKCLSLNECPAVQMVSCCPSFQGEHTAQLVHMPGSRVRDVSRNLQPYTATAHATETTSPARIGLCISDDGTRIRWSYPSTASKLNT